MYVYIDIHYVSLFETRTFKTFVSSRTLSKKSVYDTHNICWRVVIWILMILSPSNIPLSQTISKIVRALLTATGMSGFMKNMCCSWYCNVTYLFLYLDPLFCQFIQHSVGIQVQCVGQESDHAAHHRTTLTGQLPTADVVQQPYK